MNLISTEMKKVRFILVVLFMAIIIFGGSASWNKTQKGAAVGEAGEGAIIGATVGGLAGLVIENQMDKQADEIKNTVPNANVERVGEGIVVEFNSNILFRFDRSDLSDEAKANLDKLVLVLNNYDETNIELQGHTDNKGNVSYNPGLSERHAESVSVYLTSKNIDASRLTVKGFGESLPKYNNNSARGRKQNQRVELLITANEKMKSEAAKTANL